MVQQVQNPTDHGTTMLLSTIQKEVGWQDKIQALYRIDAWVCTAVHVILVKPFTLKDQIESAPFCRHFIQTGRILERPLSGYVSFAHAFFRMLRYFKQIHARETTTQELLRVHTFSHVRNYYPLDEETLVKKEKRPLKITSIAALLNPEPPRNPRIQQLSAVDKVERGVGGDTIIKADQDHINRQHRRFSTAAAFADASQSNPQPTAPPTLVCKMTCGELGISVDTTFHPLYTSLAAKVSAGALLSLVEPIVQGQLRNGFALIRPPGHHAEDDLAMGFCFYNNVAVAVADTLEKYPPKVKKAVVIDW